MTLRQCGAASSLQKKLLLSYEAYGVEVFLQFGSRSVSSVGQNRRGGSLRVVSEAVEASPVGTKPPAAVDIHPPSWVGQTQVLLFGGRVHCPRGLPRSPSVA